MVRLSFVKWPTWSQAAVAAVIAIFFGIPLWHAAREPAAVASLYAASLKTLWTGLRA